MTAKKVKVPAASAKVNDAQVAGAKAAAKTKVGGAKPVAPKVSKNASKVAVNDKNGEFIREYSSDVHGKDFLALAQEFAGKEEGRTVVES